MNYAYSAPIGDIDLTSVSDGRTHTITAMEFDAGIWQGRGRYRAVCGTEVLAAALVSGPGPRCPRCPALTEAPATVRGPGLAPRVVAALIALSGMTNLGRRTAS